MAEQYGLIAWRHQVSQILLRKIGLGLDDLADFDSYNTWRDGASPAEGALAALEFDDFGIIQELEEQFDDVLAFLAS